MGWDPGNGPPCSPDPVLQPVLFKLVEGLFHYLKESSKKMLNRYVFICMFFYRIQLQFMNTLVVMDQIKRVFLIIHISSGSCNLLNVYQNYG